ncbi:MAG: T9SS C-terminal target domain-containing protein [Ignavibacteriales bacterium]|nr:MAG: T9SS C-terminal target domain-containing protein [Ignavibacteriales bacterium]
MKKLFLLPLLLILNKISFSQDTDYLIEFEKNNFLKTYNSAQVNYPGDPAYDVIYYKLNLGISYKPQYLNGDVTVIAKSNEDSLSSFFLDLSNSLVVDSVKSDTVSLTFKHNQDILTIYLKEVLSINENFEVTVYYQGTPQTTGLGSFVFDTHNGQPSIWTLSEPYGAKEWWPCKDTPADKADSADIWITCSNNFTAVSNGRLIEIVDNRNGTYTYKWESRYPIANYLISMAISDFTFYEQHFKYSSSDSMPVVHYIYPDIFDSIKPQLDKTVLMLGIFSNLFGTYPFIREKYGHASFGKGGMEHQTISSMGIFTDGVIAHELAHQWFGDKVTCKDWGHIWLNEGFATFSEGVFIESVLGKDSYDSFIGSTMARARNALGSIYVKNINIISEIFNGPRSYSKGAIVLHMLRGITGDSLFFRILKNYLNDPALAYGVATTEDFQRVAEEVYGSSLGYFFNEWIYGENYPNYFIEWNYTKFNNNLYKIDLNIEQSHNTYPVFFTMPVQIKISTTAGDTLITLFNNIQNQFFTFNVRGEPTDFVFDPGNFILDDAFIDDPYNFDVPSEYKLLQNFPNPFNSSTTIEFQTSKREVVTIKVFDVLGNEIYTIYNKETDAGKYKINFDAAFLGSGVYFYRMNAGGFEKTKQMVLIK